MHMQQIAHLLETLKEQVKNMSPKIVHSSILMSLKPLNTSATKPYNDCLALKRYVVRINMSFDGCHTNLTRG